MMLQKLDDMYKRENEVITKSRKLKLEWEQIRDDIQVMEQLIIRESNKKAREQNTGGLNG